MILDVRSFEDILGIQTNIFRDARVLSRRLDRFVTVCSEKKYVRMMNKGSYVYQESVFEIKERRTEPSKPPDRLLPKPAAW